MSGRPESPALSQPSPSREKEAFYREKWARLCASVGVEDLAPEDALYIERAFVRFGLSFQQARQMADLSRRLGMWGEAGLAQWDLVGAEGGFWASFLEKRRSILDELPDYGGRPVLERSAAVDAGTMIRSVARQGKFVERCPAFSESYACCGMEIMNVVENCALGCSYCVLRTFYEEEKEIRVTANLEKRLLEISAACGGRLRHLCCGQYSDALWMGNRDGMLDSLRDFAEANPDLCLELKTKSADIAWFEKNRSRTPRNIFVSWSLNTETVIGHEERASSGIGERLDAARSLADLGLLVGFHFHPMVRYRGFEKDYRELAAELVRRFSPKEVIFVSQGSLNFRKRHQEKLLRGFPSSQLLRARLEPTAGNKVGYLEEHRTALYRLLDEALRPWEGRVFRYLCMETPGVYEAVFGRSYPGNEAHREEMNDAIFAKIRA